MGLSCCRPFEDEEPERLEAEVDEAPLAVREVAAEAGANHALPSGAMDRVKLLQPIATATGEQSCIGWMEMGWHASHDEGVLLPS